MSLGTREEIPELPCNCGYMMEAETVEGDRWAWRVVFCCGRCGDVHVDEGDNLP